MRCAICRGGELRSGTAIVTLDRDGATLVFRGVPARVCSTCGEEYVDEETTARVLEAADAAIRAGVKVGVQEYAAA